MNLVAVDVSKDKLDVLFDYDNKHEVIQNSKQAIKKLITRVKKVKDVKIVFESSGGYERTLKNIALDSGISCAICNGKRVREYARSQGSLAKTDKLDTYVIAQYAKVSDVTVLSSRDKDVDALKELVVRRKQILNLLKQERNKLEHEYGKLVRKTINMSVENLEKQLVMIEDKINSITNSNEKIKEKKEILETMPGIGEVAAITLIAELPELGTLSKSEIASLSGLAPLNKDSGKYRGKRKTGHSRQDIKSVLYMTSVSAIKANPKIKLFYEKLKEKGKPGKVALVACMRKMIVYANAMLKKQEGFCS